MKTYTAISVLIITFCLFSSLQAQIILDPTGTIEGSVGLEGEAFGSGSVRSSSSSSSISGTVDPTNETYSVPVSANGTASFNLYLNSFADTNNAKLRYRVYNQPALSEGEVRTLDLKTESGIIVGSASVNAGATIDRITMYTYGSDSTVPVDYYGDVKSVFGESTALQPFPAGTNIRARAAVNITLASGCSIVRYTEYITFDLGAGETIEINWSEIDVEGLACPTGNVEGTFELANLETLDATHTGTWIQIYGPSSRGSDANPNFEFLDIPTGNYSSYTNNYFEAPYQFMRRYARSPALTVEEGQTSLYNTILPVGTVSVGIETEGTWSLVDVSSSSSHLSFNNTNDGSSGYGADNSISNQQNNFVVPEGTARYQYQNLYFYSNFDGKYRFQRLRPYFYGSDLLTGNVIAGNNLDLGTVHYKTSEAPAVIFQIPTTTEGTDPLLRQIRVTGYGSVVDDNGSLVNTPYIDFNAQNYTSASQSNSISLLVRGLAGDYSLSAVAYDTEGKVYTKTFPLSLGNPDFTPEGPNVGHDLIDEDGNEIASLVFDNVTGSGNTTISQVGTGPDAPTNFAIFKTKGVNGNTGEYYYDIVTTAEFSGQVMVCINYDDTDISASQEANLELGHYLEESKTWEVITIDGYPDTENNRICGLTDSFSLFAGLVPNDTDGDGVLDIDDNCPETVNPDQKDTDGDGIGDACETDTDGDGIDDDNDLCPLTPSTNNEDLDGDGIGDICDSDRDGDGISNDEDNCPDAFNPDQFDFDFDGVGDACDSDVDGDGITNADDLCAYTPLGAPIDENGCSSDQLLALSCPPDLEYKNHGEYVSCVAEEAEYQVSIGLITEKEKGAIISEVARSDIGKQKGNNN